MNGSGIRVVRTSRAVNWCGSWARRSSAVYAVQTWRQAHA